MKIPCLLCLWAFLVATQGCKRPAQNSSPILNDPVLADIHKRYGGGRSVKTEETIPTALGLWEFLPITDGEKCLVLTVRVYPQTGKREAFIEVAKPFKTTSGSEFSDTGTPQISMKVPEEQIPALAKGLDLRVATKLFDAARDAKWAPHNMNPTKSSEIELEWPK
jgi:hypothetical protein